MFIMLILLTLLFLCFVAHKKYKKPFMAAAVVFIFILLILECSVYAYFIYQIKEGKGLLLIGNQKVLDQLYKFRLIYAIYYAKNKKDYYYSIDDELGYRIGINKAWRNYTSNGAGLRGSKEYAFRRPKDTLRIACFGDSFVFCDDEKDSDTWENIMENDVKNIEVLNFGVSGYGLGQSYLRYVKDGIRFRPHIIILSKVSFGGMRDDTDYLELIDWDMRRTDFYRVKFWIDESGKLRYRPYTVFDLFDKKFRDENIYNKLDFYKKNKLLSSKLLNLSNITLFLKTRFIKYKISKMPQREYDTPKQINYIILRDFLDLAKENGSTVIFMNFGFFETLQGNLAVKFKNNDNVKYFYQDDLFSKYYNELNPGRKSILNDTNHYNLLGNKILAKAVLEILKNNEWQNGNKIFSYDESANSFQSREK